MPILLLLTFAHGASPTDWKAGLSPLTGVAELRDASALHREAITCVHDTDAGRSERALGEVRTLRLVSALPAEPERGMRAVTYPSTASVKIAENLTARYRRDQWNTEPLVNLGDGNMQWVFTKGVVRATVLRLDDGAEYQVQVRVEQLRETVCTPYPPKAGWSVLQAFRTDAARWNLPVPGAEDQPAAAALYRAHLQGHEVGALVERYRYGRAALGDAPMHELLAAGEAADRTQLNALDLQFAWGLPNDLGAVRADACYRVLDQQTRAIQFPWTKNTYPSALELDEVFPLTGQSIPRITRLDIDVLPNGTVEAWTYDRQLASPKGRHQEAFEGWKACMGDAVKMLRFPPGEQSRHGTLVLRSDADGGVELVP